MPERPEKKETHPLVLTILQLQARGWTKGLIQKYLGVEDCYVHRDDLPPSAIGRTRRVYLEAWELDKIEAVEQSEEWPTVMKRVAARRAAANRTRLNKPKTLRLSLPFLWPGSLN